MCVTDITSYDYPQFFQISRIVYHQHAWYLGGEFLLNQTFSYHYHSYVVEHFNIWHVLRCVELNIHPLDLSNLCEKVFVRLRYRIAKLSLSLDEST